MSDCDASKSRFGRGRDETSSERVGGRGGKRITGKQRGEIPVANDKKDIHALVQQRGSSRRRFENLDDYYAIENSCVDAVLETKRGIPITLSLVYMEIAKMVGIDMIGVNLPGHFMIRPCNVPDCEILIDCFHDGDVLFVEDAEEMLSKLYRLDTAKGEKVTIDRSFLEDRFETENVLHSYAHQLEIDIFQQKRLPERVSDVRIPKNVRP